MLDCERFREHALRLLALAQAARERGQHEIADELAQLAADAFDQAADVTDTMLAMPPRLPG